MNAEQVSCPRTIGRQTWWYDAATEGAARASDAPPLEIVLYEDRMRELVGMKLAVLSARRHFPGIRIHVHVPDAGESFVAWLQRVPDTVLHADRLTADRFGYNVKPFLLQTHIEASGCRAVWLDTDIIVARPAAHLFDAVAADTLITTEEGLVAPYQGGTWHCEGWHLIPARPLRATTNTAVLAVTSEHLDLLRRWDELLAEPEYLAAQGRPWSERPIHMMGDQEVLSALLESTEFAHVPIRYLRRGSEIAHCFQHHGYVFHQMVANLARRRTPAFVHGQGDKPWREAVLSRTQVDVSPYTLAAIEYADALDEDVSWLEPSTRASSAMRRVFRDSPWSSGLPLAAYTEVRSLRFARHGVKKLLRRP